MNLHAKLQQRAAEQRPVRVGLSGAGKFGSMYLAQIPRTPGVRLVAIADLSPAAARADLARVGWQPELADAQSAQDAISWADVAIDTRTHAYQVRREMANMFAGVKK